MFHTIKFTPIKLSALVLSASLMALYSSPAISKSEEINFTPEATLNSETTGNPLLRDLFGQTIAINDDYLFVSAQIARTTPSAIASGAIYVYKKDATGSWNKVQIISTQGMSDHLGGNEIQAKGKWLLFSAIGTPIGSVANDAVQTQDFKGSVQVYKRNDKTGLYEFSQAIDSNTAGLEGLTAIDPLGFTIPPGFETLQLERGANFGLHFSLNDDLLLVGALFQQNTDNNNNPLINSGMAYLLKLNGTTDKWELVQSLTNPDGKKASNTFGYNVKLKDKVALISSGSFFEFPKIASIAENSAVYVYRVNNNQLSFVQKIVGDQNTLPFVPVQPIPGLNPYPAGDGFGVSMALEDEYAIIGAPLESKDPNVNTLSGAFYFYKITYDTNGSPTLTQTQKNYSDDTKSYLSTLATIDMTNKLAVISDPGRSGPSGYYQGGALVYQLDTKDNTWKQVSVLYNPNGAQNGFFGSGVAIDKKGTIALGAGQFGSILLPRFGASIGTPYHPPLIIAPPLPTTPVIIYHYDDK